MIRWKTQITGGVAVVALSFAGFYLNPASGAVSSHRHPKTGVGSCTLKGWSHNKDPRNATKLPLGKRPQTYRPDNYNCTGAVFAKPGVEFKRFPQPQNYRIKTRGSVLPVRMRVAGACRLQPEVVLQPTQAINPLAPYFPPFTHFVILFRENHTFDDYLGDCATTIQTGCNGQVQSTNHI